LLLWPFWNWKNREEPQKRTKLGILQSQKSVSLDKLFMKHCPFENEEQYKAARMRVPKMAKNGQNSISALSI
jgi:hypothetical protein